MKHVDITVLVENTVNAAGLRAEHGLSLHIDAGGYRILFDTGASALFLGNAKKLGLHLNELDALVLSHNHYDHTGGIEFLIDLYAKIPPIFTHPKSLGHCYAKPKNEERSARQSFRSIGFPYPLGLKGLQTRGLRLEMNREMVQIRRDIWLSGEIARNCPFEQVGESFFLDPELSRPDNLPDDQALILKTEAGLIVTTGCCHSGLVNTLEAVINSFPDVPIRAVVGGFHLLHADSDRIDASVRFLEQLDPQLVIAGHCTGFDALCRLRSVFGERFQRLSVGKRFSLPDR